MDPLSLVMFGLIAVLIFFMFRNGKKRQQAQLDMQNNVRPGAEVMLQSGIYGTIESVDEEENRVTVRSGTSTIVVHRNAVGQILTPADDVSESEDLAPDDDPEFGERLSGAKNDAGSVNDNAAGQEVDASEESGAPEEPSALEESGPSGESGEPEAPGESQKP